MAVNRYGTSPGLCSVRVFVLLSWSGSVGLPTRPVGALAVEEASGAYRVAWMPLAYDAATAWRLRLRAAAGADIRRLLDSWLDQTSVLGLAEVPASDGDLRACAEIGLERLLVNGTG